VSARPQDSTGDEHVLLLQYGNVRCHTVCPFCTVVIMVTSPLATERPASTALHALPRVDEGLDLRDVTSSVYETCSALGLSLREGDLVAAERLFSFVVDQIPDRRLVLTDVLQPLIASELAACGPAEARLFGRTCYDLLIRLRRPPINEDGSVLLVAPEEAMDTLSMHMVALMLDEFSVPSTVFIENDTDALAVRSRSGQETVACVAVSEGLAGEHITRYARALRNLRTIVLFRGPHEQDYRLSTWIAGVVGGMGEAVDAVLQLRGPLTSAEVTVLRLAADGYTNVRIAHELGISVSAVKARLEGSYSKLKAADRAHAVAIALRQRWMR
jgi:DNA-binding CsgD family transcriptional regulator